MSQFPTKEHRVGKDRRNKRSLGILLFILVTLFVFICFVFIREYLLLQHEGVLRVHQLRNNITQYPIASTSPLQISNVEMIENWMTFDYINESFQLPPSVLQDGLHIIDPHYPRMSIRRAARERGTSRDIYLLEVKTVIREYLLSNKAP